MLQFRYLLALLVSVLGISSMVIAFVALLYPVSAITETKGRVIETVPPQAVVQYQTAHGVDITITDTLPANVSATSGDPIPVTYFPWAPQDARIGSIGKSVGVAIGFQWMMILAGSLLGAGMSVAGIYLFRSGRKQQYLLLSLYIAITALLVALPIIPRPSVAP